MDSSHSIFEHGKQWCLNGTNGSSKMFRDEVLNVIEGGLVKGVEKKCFSFFIEFDPITTEIVNSYPMRSILTVEDNLSFETFDEIIKSEGQYRHYSNVFINYCKELFEAVDTDGSGKISEKIMGSNL